MASSFVLHNSVQGDVVRVECRSASYSTFNNYGKQSVSLKGFYSLKVSMYALKGIMRFITYHNVGKHNDPYRIIVDRLPAIYIHNYFGANVLGHHTHTEFRLRLLGGPREYKYISIDLCNPHRKEEFII